MTHALKFSLRVYGRNDTCTRFSLKWLWFMDIKMKNLYLDLLQILTVGAFTRYLTFQKRRDPEATWPLTDSTFRTYRS